LVFSETAQEHEQHLRTLFTRLQLYGILINHIKCVLQVKEISFMGYKISPQGSQPLPERVTDLQNCTPPKTIRHLRRFLGLLNFYRRFIPQAASQQAPLHNLLSGPKVKATTPITWTSELHAAFQSCKESLAHATLLAHPHPSAPFALVTDASTTAMGAVLQQLVRNSWQPLAFFSRKLTPAQQKYSAYDRELLAIYEAVRYFRHMLEALHFTIYTDHKPLIFAFRHNRDKCSPRQFRHLDFIAEFTTDIQHVSGKENIVADALSRVDAISASPTQEALATAQETDEELQRLLIGGTSLQLDKIPVPGTSVALFCDTAHDRPRPFVPSSLRKQVFDALYSINHPGIKASAILVSQ
jgi:cleavage and polyadenylation specificity factor subunit 1